MRNCSIHCNRKTIALRANYCRNLSALHSLSGVDKVPEESAYATLLGSYAALGRSFPAMAKEAVVGMIIWKRELSVRTIKSFLVPWTYLALCAAFQALRRSVAIVSAGSPCAESSHVRTYLESVLSYLLRHFLKEMGKKTEEAAPSDINRLTEFPYQLLECQNLRDFLLR